MIVLFSELANASTDTVRAAKEDEPSTARASRRYSRLVITHLEAIVESICWSLSVWTMVCVASTAEHITVSGLVDHSLAVVLRTSVRERGRCRRG